MKSERIYQAIGNVNDDLIERYEGSKKKNLHWIKWNGLVACLCLMIISFVTLNGTFNIKKRNNDVIQRNNETVRELKPADYPLRDIPAPSGEDNMVSGTGGDSMKGQNSTETVGEEKPDGYSAGNKPSLSKENSTDTSTAKGGIKDQNSVVDQRNNETVEEEKPADYPVGNTPSPSEAIYVASGTVINSFQPDSIAGMYAVPNNGEKTYFNEVTNALKEHDGQDVTYFLAIDIYANQTKLEDTSNRVKVELERLTKLGDRVGYSKCWTYQGNNEKVDILYVSGYFTEEQLENFPASENYGYTFRFATNGDGSSVSADQGIITDVDSEMK